LAWKPKWYPIVDFQDALEFHAKEWQMHESEGCFRMVTLPGFAHDLSSSSSDRHKITAGAFDNSKAKFIRAKLICDMTFSQRMELRYFPFDCQSLSCVIKEDTEIHGGTKCVFLPELRPNAFGVVDPNRWVINEWNFEQSLLEFADLNVVNQDTTSSAIILSIKLSRRFSPTVINTFCVVFGLCGLALAAFAIDYEAVDARLVYVLTVILTMVLFDPNASSPPPFVTVLDKYMLSTYAYLLLSMIAHSWGNHIGSAENDWIACITFMSLYAAYNLVLVAYMVMVRKRERHKLSLSYHEIQQHLWRNERNHKLRVSRFHIQHRMKKEIEGGKKSLAFYGQFETN